VWRPQTTRRHEILSLGVKTGMYLMSLASACVRQVACVRVAFGRVALLSWSTTVPISQTFTVLAVQVNVINAVAVSLG
jgi:hypothetical protein